MHTCDQAFYINVPRCLLLGNHKYRIINKLFILMSIEKILTLQKVSWLFRVAIHVKPKITNKKSQYCLLWLTALLETLTKQKQKHTNKTHTNVLFFKMTCTKT